MFGALIAGQFREASSMQTVGIKSRGVHLVRFGSFADIKVGISDVRFTLESGHDRSRNRRPLSADIVDLVGLDRGVVP